MKTGNRILDYLSVSIIVLLGIQLLIRTFGSNAAALSDVARIPEKHLALMFECSVLVSLLVFKTVFSRFAIGSICTTLTLAYRLSYYGELIPLGCSCRTLSNMFDGRSIIGNILFYFPEIIIFLWVSMALTALTVMLKQKSSSKTSLTPAV